jgi:magnesium transporter
MASTSNTHLTFETAEEHASSAVPIAAPSHRVDEIRSMLTGRQFDNANHIVVCESGKFLGIIRIETLLAAPDGSAASQLMDRDAPVVRPGVDQEVAAWRAVQHQESALAVVDKAGRFVGLIPPHRLLAVLLLEHEEDLARLGGFLKETAVARKASQEPVPRRFWHRVPWLFLGLGGALVAADIIAAFEAELHRRVILAFFVPGIVYLADAVGTQTETVVVRGLSVGVAMRHMLRRELLTGLVMGLALGAISFPAVWLRWADRDLAVGVALAVFAACSTATLAAMALPWLFDLLGLDPAFGSGPLATVIQDLLSILIYFMVATAVV